MSLPSGENTPDQGVKDRQMYTEQEVLAKAIDRINDVVNPDGRETRAEIFGWWESDSVIETETTSPGRQNVVATLGAALQPKLFAEYDTEVHPSEVSSPFTHRKIQVSSTLVPGVYMEKEFSWAQNNPRRQQVITRIGRDRPGHEPELNTATVATRGGRLITPEPTPAAI